LAVSDIDDGEVEACGFDDSGAAVASHEVGVLHGGEVERAKIFDCHQVGESRLDLFDGLPDGESAGVGVGHGEEGLVSLVFQSVKECFGLGSCFGWFGRDGMKCGKNIGLYEARNLVLEGFEWGNYGIEDPIEPRGTGDMDVGRIFSHLNDALGMEFGAGEVDMAHLCESVAVDVIDCAGGFFSAVDVRYGDEIRSSGGTGGEHFVSVAKQDEEVGVEVLEGLGEAFYAFRGCNVDAMCIVLILRHFDGCGDGVAVGADLIDGVPESGTEVGGGDNELEFEFLGFDDFVEDWLEEAVVAAGDSDDRDFSLHIRSS